MLMLFNENYNLQALTMFRSSIITFLGKLIGWLQLVEDGKYISHNKS